MDMELDIMVMDTLLDTMERDKPYTNTLIFGYQEMTLDSGDKFSKPAG